MGYREIIKKVEPVGKYGKRLKSSSSELTIVAIICIGKLKEEILFPLSEIGLYKRRKMKIYRKS